MTAHSFVSSPGHQLFFFFSSSHFSLSHTYTHFSFSKEEDGAVSIKTYSSIKRRDPLVILHFFKKDPLYSFVYTISSFQIYPLYVRYAKCDKFSKWKILLSSFLEKRHMLQFYNVWKIRRGSGRDENINRPVFLPFERRKKRRERYFPLLLMCLIIHLRVI